MHVKKSITKLLLSFSATPNFYFHYFFHISFLPPLYFVHSDTHYTLPPPTSSIFRFYSANFFHKPFLSPTTYITTPLPAPKPHSAILVHTHHSLVPRLSESLVKLATRMCIISPRLYGNQHMSALCPYTCDVTYHWTNTSKRKAWHQQVVVYLYLCETESICLVRRLFLLSLVWLTSLCRG